MEVVAVTHVDAHGQPRVLKAERMFLRLAQLGPLRLLGAFLCLHVVGKLHDIEGKGIPPVLPPVMDHQRQQVAVLRRARHVGLALVPDGAADGIVHERLIIALKRNVG